MKTKLSVVLLLVLSISGAAGAQNKNKVDEAGVQFWTKFKTAVAKNDKETTASMTRLPFLFQSRELTKPGFIQKFDTIFNVRVKRCFATAKLIKEGDGFEVFCGQQIFLFEKVGGIYKFTEIGVND
jgi:hypothetical protein